MKWILTIALIVGAFAFGYQAMGKADIYACEDDSFCRLKTMKDCCGHEAQGCYGVAASDLMIQNAIKESCDRVKVDCNRKPMPITQCGCANKKCVAAE